MPTYLPTYLLTCTCARIYEYTYIHTYIHTHTYTHTYIYTYINTYIHTYIHVRTYGGSWLLCIRVLFVWVEFIPRNLYLFRCVICNTSVDVIGSVNLLHVRVQCSYTILHRSIIVTLNVVIRFVFVIDMFVFWEEEKKTFQSIFTWTFLYKLLIFKFSRKYYSWSRWGCWPRQVLCANV